MISNVIISYITAFVSILVQVNIFKKLNGLNNTKSLMHLLLGALVISFLPLLSLYINNPIISCALSILLYFLIEHISVRKDCYNINYVIFLWGLNIILEMFLSLPLSIINIDTITKMKLNITFTIILSFVLNIVILMLFSIKNFINKVRNIVFFSKYDKKTYSIIYIILIESIILGLIIGSDFINQLTKIVFAIILLLSDIICLIFAGHLKEENKLLHQKSALIEENVNINHRLKDYKEFKHNLIHSLNGLKSLTDDSTSLLINNIINDYNNYTFNNRAINDFNLEKFVRSYLINDNSKLKIYINNEINNEFSISSKQFNELCKSVGIALDNARESASKSKEKIITIEIFKEKNKIKIEIINSFNNCINIDEIGSKLFTTKCNHDGIGLVSLSKNHVIKNYLSIKNNLFFHTIIYPLNTKKKNKKHS